MSCGLLLKACCTFIQYGALLAGSVQQIFPSLRQAAAQQEAFAMQRRRSDAGPQEFDPEACIFEGQGVVTKIGNRGAEGLHLGGHGRFHQITVSLFHAAC